MASLGMKDYARQTTEILQEAIKFLAPVDYDERVTLSIKESIIMDQSSDVSNVILNSRYDSESF